MDTKNKKMKVWELSLLIALCVSLCTGAWAQSKQEKISSGLIRLHVIAVSDSDTEQEIKLCVRDSVLDYLSPRLEAVSDSESAQEIIRSELEGIKLAAENASCGRSVRVSLSEEYYPTRIYDGFSLPAGRYESLRVILGEGEGHNWWCVVFPPLCVSAAEQEKALDAMSDDVRGIVGNDEGHVIRFRIVELWNELCEALGFS